MKKFFIFLQLKKAKQCLAFLRISTFCSVVVVLFATDANRK